MPFKFLVNAPQMFLPGARRRMQLAEKRAGLSLVTLTSEAHSALSYLVAKITDQSVQIGKPLLRGSRILMADLGSGTGDLVLYECKEDLNQSSSLQAISQSAGDLAGSVPIDELMLTSLCNSQGKSCAQLATKHGLPETTLRRRVLQEIEQTKRVFDQQEEHWLIVRGGPGYPPFVFTVTRQQFTKAFDFVIRDVVAMIDRTTEEAAPDLIEVTGGFTKSRYMMRKLQGIYRPRGIIVVRPHDHDNAKCSAVALEGLYQHSTIDTGTLLNTFGYAALQQEEYEEGINTDAWHDVACGDGMRPEVDHEIIIRSPTDPETNVVEDRLFTAIEPGTSMQPGKVFETWWCLTFRPSINEDLEITQTFVCLRKSMPDSSRGRNPDGMFCECVEPWATVAARLDRHELERRHCAKESRGWGLGKKRWYELSMTVVLQCINDQGVRVGFKLNAGQNDRGRLKKKWGEETRAQLIAQDEADLEEYIVREDLWDANYSEFMKEEVHDFGDAMEVGS